MNELQRIVFRAAIDKMGVALAEHNHQWTPTERMAYDSATAMLDDEDAKASHAPDCAIALNGRHACSCKPNAPLCVNKFNREPLASDGNAQMATGMTTGIT